MTNPPQRVCRCILHTHIMYLRRLVSHVFGSVLLGWLYITMYDTGLLYRPLPNCLSSKCIYEVQKLKYTCDIKHVSHTLYDTYEIFVSHSSTGMCGVWGFRVFEWIMADFCVLNPTLTTVQLPRRLRGLHGFSTPRTHEIHPITRFDLWQLRCSAGKVTTYNSRPP